MEANRNNTALAAELRRIALQTQSMGFDATASAMQSLAETIDRNPAVLVREPMAAGFTQLSVSTSH